MSSNTNYKTELLSKLASTFKALKIRNTLTEKVDSSPSQKINVSDSINKITKSEVVGVVKEKPKDDNKSEGPKTTTSSKAPSTTVSTAVSSSARIPPTKLAVITSPNAVITKKKIVINTEYQNRLERMASYIKNSKQKDALKKFYDAIPLITFSDKNYESSDFSSLVNTLDEDKNKLEAVAKLLDTMAINEVSFEFEKYPYEFSLTVSGKEITYNKYIFLDTLSLDSGAFLLGRVDFAQNINDNADFYAQTRLHPFRQETKIHLYALNSLFENSNGKKGKAFVSDATLRHLLFSYVLSTGNFDEEINKDAIAKQAPLNLIQNASLYSKTAPNSDTFKKQIDTQKEFINTRISLIIDSFDLSKAPSKDGNNQKISLALLTGLFRCLQALPVAEQSLKLSSPPTKLKNQIEPFELASKILGSMQRDNYYVAFKNPFHNLDFSSIDTVPKFWSKNNVPRYSKIISEISKVADKHIESLFELNKLSYDARQSSRRRFRLNESDIHIAIETFQKFYESDYFKTQKELLMQELKATTLTNEQIDSVIFPQFVKALLDSEGFLGFISNNRYCNLAQDKIHGLFGFASAPDLKQLRLALVQASNKKVFLSKDGRIFVKPEFEIISDLVRYINKDLIDGLLNNIEASSALNTEASSKPSQKTQKNLNASTCLLSSKLPEATIAVLGSLSDISNKNEANEALKVELALDFEQKKLDVSLFLETTKSSKETKTTSKLSPEAFSFDIVKSDLLSKHSLKALQIPSKFFFLLEPLKYAKEAKLMVLEYYSRGETLGDIKDTITKDAKTKLWGTHDIIFQDDVFENNETNTSNQSILYEQGFNEGILKRDLPASLYSYCPLRPEYLENENKFSDWSLVCRKKPKYAKEAFGNLCLVIESDQGLSIIPLIEIIDNKETSSYQSSFIQLEEKDYSIINEENVILDESLKKQVVGFNQAFKHALFHQMFFRKLEPNQARSLDKYIISYTKKSGRGFSDPPRLETSHPEFLSAYGTELLEEGWDNIAPLSFDAVNHVSFLKAFKDKAKPFDLDESQEDPRLLTLLEIEELRSTESKSLIGAILSFYEALPDPLTIKNSNPGNVFPYEIFFLRWGAFKTNHFSFDTQSNSFKYSENTSTSIINRNASLVSTLAVNLDQIQNFLDIFDAAETPKKLHDTVYQLAQYSLYETSCFFDNYSRLIGASKKIVDTSSDYISNIKLKAFLKRGHLPSKLDELGILKKDEFGQYIVEEITELGDSSKRKEIALKAPEGFSGVRIVEAAPTASNILFSYRTIILFPQTKAIKTFEDVRCIYPFLTDSGDVLTLDLIKKELELLYPEHHTFAQNQGSVLPPSKPEQAILPSMFFDRIAKNILKAKSNELEGALKIQKQKLEELKTDPEMQLIEAEDTLNEKISKISSYITASLKDNRITPVLETLFKNPIEKKLVLWLNKRNSSIPGWIKASECKNYITSETFISTKFEYEILELLTPVEYITKDSAGNPSVTKLPFWYVLKAHYESLDIDIVFAPESVSYLGPKTFPPEQLADIQISPVFPPNFFELDKNKFLNLKNIKWYEYPITITDQTFNVTANLEDDFLLSSGFYSAFLGFIRTKSLSTSRDKKKINQILDDLATNPATKAESEQIKNLLNSFLNFSTELREQNMKNNKLDIVYNMDTIYFQLCTWWVDLSDEQREYFVQNYTKTEALAGLKKLKLPDHFNYELDVPTSMTTKMSQIAQRIGVEKVDFHPYQKAAINACIKQDRMVLQMEMGLGKTLTALGLFNKLLEMPEYGIEQMFILAPNSAHGSWTDHVEKWTNNKIRIITPTGLSSAKSFEGELYDFERKAFDIALVTQQTIEEGSLFYDPNKTEKIMSMFKRIGKRILLIVDEVHDFKGSDAKRALSLRKLSEYSKRVIGMTGTLKPNTVLDIYNILERIAPGCFGGSEEDFTQKYCLSGGDKSKTLTTFNPTKIFEFNKKSTPFIFTRLLSDEDVKIDLPPIQTITHHEPLDEDQESILNRLLVVLKLNTSDYNPTKEELEKAPKFSKFMTDNFNDIVVALDLHKPNAEYENELLKINEKSDEDPRYSISAIFRMLDKLTSKMSLLESKIQYFQELLNKEQKPASKKDTEQHIANLKNELQNICDNYEDFEAIHPHRFKIQQMKKKNWFDQDLQNLSKNNSYGLNTGDLVSIPSENSENSESQSPPTHRTASEVDKICWQIAGLADVRTAMAFHYANEKLSISPSVLLASHKGFESLWDDIKPDYCSSKIRYIGETIKKHLQDNPGRGVLAFCEYLKGMDVLRKQLVDKFEVKNTQIEFYYGDVPQKKRLILQQRFNDPQAKEPIKVLIAQPKTLATGANLQDNCNFVVFLTTPWSPDLITQPQARVWRQGQTKPVFVIRPTCSDIDRKKEAYITSKMQGSAQAAGGSGTGEVAVAKSIGTADRTSAKKASSASVFSIAYLLSTGSIKLDTEDTQSEEHSTVPKNSLFVNREGTDGNDTAIITYTKKVLDTSGSITSAEEKHFIVKYEHENTILKNDVVVPQALGDVFDDTTPLKVLNAPALSFLAENVGPLTDFLKNIVKKEVAVSVQMSDNLSIWILYFSKQIKNKKNETQESNQKYSLATLFLDAFNLTFKSRYLKNDVSLTSNNNLFDERNVLNYLIESYRELKRYNTALRAFGFFKFDPNDNFYRLDSIHKDFKSHNKPADDISLKLKRLLAFVCLSNNMILLSNLIYKCNEYLSNKSDEELESYYQSKEIANAKNLFSESIILSGKELKGSKIFYINAQGASNVTLVEFGPNDTVYYAYPLNTKFPGSFDFIKFNVFNNFLTPTSFSKNSGISFASDWSPICTTLRFDNIMNADSLSFVKELFVDSLPNELSKILSIAIVNIHTKYKKTSDDLADIVIKNLKSVKIDQNVPNSPSELLDNDIFKNSEGVQVSNEDLYRLYFYVSSQLFLLKDEVYKKSYEQYLKNKTTTDPDTGFYWELENNKLSLGTKFYKNLLDAYKTKYLHSTYPGQGHRLPSFNEELRAKYLENPVEESKRFDKLLGFVSKFLICSVLRFTLSRHLGILENNGLNPKDPAAELYEKLASNYKKTEEFEDLSSETSKKIVEIAKDRQFSESFVKKMLLEDNLREIRAFASAIDTLLMEMKDDLDETQFEVGLRVCEMLLADFNAQKALYKKS